MRAENNNLQKKNDELAKAFQEKNRKLLQTQELYDRLKQKALLGQVQDAAESAIDSALYPPRVSEQRLGENSRLSIPVHSDSNAPYEQYHSSRSRGIQSFHHPGEPERTGSWFRTVGGGQSQFIDVAGA